MGVPKFYRWISERYPCLSEVLKEYQVAYDPSPNLHPRILYELRYELLKPLYILLESSYMLGNCVNIFLLHVLLIFGIACLIQLLMLAL